MKSANGIGRRALGGAGAGIAATVAMSVLLVAAKRAGLVGKHPPKKITEKALDFLHIPRTEETENAAATLAHFGYGMASGAVFGALVRGRLLPTHPIAEGIVWGGFVYAVSYLGWVPAATIMPPPPFDRPGRQLTTAVGHVVYGAVLGRLTPKRPPPPPPPITSFRRSTTQSEHLPTP